MKRREVLAGIMLLAWSAAANASYMTYSQWAALPLPGRSLYIAGAFDALVTISRSSDDKYQAHYNTCLVNAKMMNSQLAENVSTFASTHPELQSGGVVHALLNYLIALCGVPPK